MEAMAQGRLDRATTAVTNAKMEKNDAKQALEEIRERIAEHMVSLPLCSAFYNPPSVFLYSGGREHRLAGCSGRLMDGGTTGD